MNPKWHYFNHIVDEYPRKDRFGRKIDEALYTACGRDVNTIKRHTEFKSAVTCVKCLQMIVRIEAAP